MEYGRACAHEEFDVLIFAFGFLDFKALGRAENVCCVWRNIAQTDDAWRAIHFALGGSHELAPDTCTVKSSTKVRALAVLAIIPDAFRPFSFSEDIESISVEHTKIVTGCHASLESLMRLAIPIVSLLARCNSGVYRRTPSDPAVLRLPYFTPRPFEWTAANICFYYVYRKFLLHLPP